MRPAVIFLLLCSIAAPAHSGLISINFNGLSSGAKVSDQYAALGVTISLIGSDHPTVFPAVDSDGVYTAVHGVPGNFLLPGLVDGEAFDIRFAFASPIDFMSILVLDAEEAFELRASLAGTPVSVPRSTSSAGSYSNVFPVGHIAVGGTLLASIGAIGGAELFDEVILDLTNGPTMSTPESVAAGGPEYFDNLSFNTVAAPVSAPSTLLLLLVGLSACSRHMSTKFTETNAGACRYAWFVNTVK